MALHSEKSMRLSDCICPICMDIYIEPVTMPCAHELCMPCFKQNVQEANLTCPMCRTRISTWARRATRHNKLINQERWTEIKQAFPLKIKRRIDGEDWDSSDNDENDLMKPIAEPGAIRKEYEEQLHKIEAERERQQLIEEKASADLLQQLSAELQSEESRRKVQEARDEVLAKEMADVLQQGLQTPEIGMHSKKRGKSKPKTLLDKFVRRGASHTDQMSDPGTPTGPFIDLCMADSNAAQDAYPFVCTTPSEKQESAAVKVVSERRRYSDIFRADSSSSGSTVDFMYAGTRSSTSRSPGSQEDCAGTNLTIKEESTSLDASLLDSCSKISMSGISRDASHPDLPDCEDTSSLLSRCDDLTDPGGGGESGPSGSYTKLSLRRNEDSISRELNHFRPIEASPLTPPKRFPGGRIQKPAFVRSIPLHSGLDPKRQGSISRSHSSGADPETSVMQKRLLELAAERQAKVNDLSKATLTEVRGPPSRHIVREHSYCSPKKGGRGAGDDVTGSAGTDALKKCPGFFMGGDAGGSQPPPLPLEPRMADHQGDLPRDMPTLDFHPHLGPRDPGFASTRSPRESPKNGSAFHRSAELHLKNKMLSHGWVGKGSPEEDVAGKPRRSTSRPGSSAGGRRQVGGGLVSPGDKPGRQQGHLKMWFSPTGASRGSYTVTTSAPSVPCDSGRAATRGSTGASGPSHTDVKRGFFRTTELCLPNHELTTPTRVARTPPTARRPRSSGVSTSPVSPARLQAGSSPVLCDSDEAPPLGESVTSPSSRDEDLRLYDNDTDASGRDAVAEDDPDTRTTSSGHRHWLVESGSNESTHSELLSSDPEESNPGRKDLAFDVITPIRSPSPENDAPRIRETKIKSSVSAVGDRKRTPDACGSEAQIEEANRKSGPTKRASAVPAEHSGTGLRESARWAHGDSACVKMTTGSGRSSLEDKENSMDSCDRAGHEDKPREGGTMECNKNNSALCKPTKEPKAASTRNNVGKEGKATSKLNNVNKRVLKKGKKAAKTTCEEDGLSSSPAKRRKPNRGEVNTTPRREEREIRRASHFSVEYTPEDKGKTLVKYASKAKVKATVKATSKEKKGKRHLVQSRLNWSSVFGSTAESSEEYYCEDDPPNNTSRHVTSKDNEISAGECENHASNSSWKDKRRKGGKGKVASRDVLGGVSRSGSDCSRRPAGTGRGDPDTDASDGSSVFGSGDPLDTPQREREDFATDTAFREYVEEQDRLVALRLQAEFDLEARHRLTAIRTKGSDGEYHLRAHRARNDADLPVAGSSGVSCPARSVSGFRSSRRK